MFGHSNAFKYVLKLTLFSINASVGSFKGSSLNIEKDSFGLLFILYLTNDFSMFNLCDAIISLAFWYSLSLLTSA